MSLTSAPNAIKSTSSDVRVGGSYKLYYVYLNTRSAICSRPFIHQQIPTFLRYFLFLSNSPRILQNRPLVRDVMENLHPNRVSTGYLNYDIISRVLTLLSMICVTLRFIQRRQIRNIWWDDWAILIALILGIGVFITNVLISLPSIGAVGYNKGYI